jgi:hypothetical protein
MPETPAEEEGPYGTVLDASSRSPYAWFAAGVGTWALAAGMQQVLFAWLVAGELREAVKDTLRGSVLPSLPFLDPAAVLDLLDRAPTIADPEERNGAYSGLTLVTRTPASPRSRVASPRWALSQNSARRHGGERHRKDRAREGALGRA